MNENVYKDIGANIVFHRKLRGLTQVVLARNVNIGVGKLSRIERGIDVEEMPLSVYLRIAESMNVNIVELLKTTEVKAINICVHKKLVK